MRISRKKFRAFFEIFVSGATSVPANNNLRSGLVRENTRIKSFRLPVQIQRKSEHFSSQTIVKHRQTQ